MRGPSAFFSVFSLALFLRKPMEIQDEFGIFFLMASSVGFKDR